MAAGLLVATALAAVGWIDYQATRGELVLLLRDQARSLRGTVAAAVRASRAAATEAERQLGARLLDNARLIRELDRRGALDQAALDEISTANGLFWITVYDAGGRRERASGGPRGLGPGPGGGAGAGGPGGPGPGRGGGTGGGRGAGAAGRAGPGAGQGPGPGASGGGAQLLESLLTGPDTEAVSEMHTGRGGAARVAAGVRRARGGVILLNADATVIAEIERAHSLDILLGDIAAGTDELAYLVLESDAQRLVHGIEAGELPAPDPTAALDDAPEREVTAGGRPVLELAGPVEIAGLDHAWLRVGMRLDGVRRAERQTLVRLAGSLSTALVLTLVALGFLGLRRQYGELQERHQAAEEALRRRDRLTAMGELASTVAHEVRNPLNAIAMAARRLTREFATSSDRPADPADLAELKDLLAVVEGETRRIDAIVQQFLEFARPPALVRQDVNLAGFARGLVEAHRPLAATRSVMLDLDAAGAGRASVDPSQLRQAADNLVRNAIEATPSGGRVRVGVRREGAEQVLEVEDSGAGIVPEHLPKIFDLYFTTKPGGTGVGLAVTHQIVSAHGGTIEVDSRPGQGTRMTIRLPHVEGLGG